jgi:hypothetical protein
MVRDTHDPQLLQELFAHGVTNDGCGTLAGYAWSENAGSSPRAALWWRCDPRPAL